MKVFDATSLIAFLSEMDFPEGLEALSRHYKLIVPEGVFAEIKKSPGRERLKELSRRGTITVEKVDQGKAETLMKEYPQLHRGECEAVVCAQDHAQERKTCVLSDDSRAREIFGTLNFKWTERLLEIMKERQLITDQAYCDKLNCLHSSPFYSLKRRLKA